MAMLGMDLPAASRKMSLQLKYIDSNTPKTCCDVETAHYGPGRREVLFQYDPIWNGGLSWKEPGKGKDWCYLSLPLKKGWGRRRREGESKRDSTLEEGREECIKCH